MNYNKRFISLVIGLIFFMNFFSLFSNTSFTALAEGTEKPLIISKYNFTLWKNSATDMDPSKNICRNISKGMAVNLFLTVVDPNNTYEFDSAKAGIILKSGAFNVVDSLSQPKITITPVGKEGFIAGKTTFIVHISGIVYSGKGNSVDLTINYVDTANKSFSYDLSSSFPECEEYVKQPEIPVDPPQPLDPITPYIKVVNYSTVPISSTNKVFKFTIENTSSSYTVENMNIKITPPEGLVLGSSNIIHISSLGTKKQVENTIELKVKNDAKSDYGSLALDFSFQYQANASRKSGSNSEVLPVSIENNIKSPLIPTLRIENASGMLYGSPGELGLMKFNLSNTSKEKSLQSIVVKVTVPEGFYLPDSTSIYIEELKPGETLEKSVSFEINKGAKNGYYTASLDSTYQYETGNTVASGTSSDKISVSIISDENMFTPRIILGDIKMPKTIYSGDTFPLNMAFLNTHDVLSAKNIVIKLTLPEDLSFDNSSNTFFIKELKGGDILNKSININVRSSCKVQRAAITVDIAYQYNNKDVLTDSTSTAIVPIQISQVERVELNPGQLPLNLIVGEEQIYTVNLVNKGRSNIYNVTAIIDGNIQNSGQNQFKGNLESGKELPIDFSLIAMAEGEVKGEITITYEDDNMKVKTLKLPYTVIAQPPFVPPIDNGGIVEPIPPEKVSIFSNKIVLGGIITAVILVIVIIFIALKIRKNKRQRKLFLDEDI